MAKERTLDEAAGSGGEYDQGPDDQELELTVEEPLPEDAEAEIPFVYDEESKNLVPEFLAHVDGKAALKTIATKVIDDFDNAWEASEEYRQRMSNDWKIFAGDLPPKAWPHKDAANVHVPILIENITRVAFTMFGELFSEGEFFTVAPVGPDDKEIARNLTIHGNWQFRTQIPDFHRQQHRGVLGFFFIGDVTFHSFFDGFRKENRHEFLTPDEFVTPFVYTSTMPDYSDVPYRVKILNLYRHELQAKKSEWHGVQEMIDGKAPTWMDEPEQPLAQGVSEVSGVMIPESSKVAPYKILWYEGWLELPNQVDDRFCQAIVDYRSKTILKLAIHEHAHWQDKMRYDAELAELTAFRQEETAYNAQTAELEGAQYELGQMAAQGLTGPEAGARAAEQLEQTRPPAPLPPRWMKDPADPAEVPAKPRKAPIHLFAHGVCIEPLVGNLGLSYGRQQADFNRAANTALNQFTDAATLANVWSIITPDTVSFENPFMIAPGKVNKAKGMIGTELERNIMQLKGAEPSPALMQLVKEIIGWSRSSMHAENVLSGASGKSGETYRGLAVRLEQATKQISVAGGKYKGLLKQIVENNAKLNAMFLPEDELLQIFNHDQQSMVELAIGRRLYDRNYRVEVRADLRFTTQAMKIAEADELLMMPEQVPQLRGNLWFIYESLKRALLARGLPDMVTKLGPAPPGDGPPTPLGMMAPPNQLAPGGVPGSQPANGAGGPPVPKGPPEPPTPRAMG